MTYAFKPFKVSRRTFAAGAAAAGASLSFSSLARAEPKSIGFIYVGPRLDYGYNACSSKRRSA